MNRVFRCRHRHRTSAFTPRGEDRCYAVCLDCGQRLEPQWQVLRGEIPRNPGSPEAPAGDGGTEKAGTTPARESPVRAPRLSEPASPRPHRSLTSGWHDLLWVGLFVVGLSGGLYVSSHFRAGRENAPSPQPKSLSGASGSSHRGEMQPLRQAAKKRPAAPDDSPVSPSATHQTKGPNAPLAADALATGKHGLRLEGKGPMVVLGREEAPALELLQDPGRLSTLIQAGSLFTVPHGTAIELGEKKGRVIQVVITDGPMAGQQGWAPTWQVRRE